MSFDWVSPWPLMHATLGGAPLYSTSYVSSTGNFNIFISEHMKQVLTMLSFETLNTWTTMNDLASLENLECLKVDNIESHKLFLLSVGHGVLALPSGVQKTVEVPQDQQMHRIVDLTVVLQHQLPTSQQYRRRWRLYDQGHPTALVSSLREPPVQNHLVQQRLQLRWQLCSTASLRRTRTAVSSVFFVTSYTVGCGVNLPGNGIEPPVNISF